MNIKFFALGLATAVILTPGAPAQDNQEAPAQEIDVPAGRLGTFPGYIPAGASKANPCPLVVACHGHGDSARNFLACMKAPAAHAKVALLVPEGVEKLKENSWGWNNFPDRAKVIEGAIRAMLKSHPINPRQILWMGHSAGTWVCCGDGVKMPDLCHGLLLTAAPTADLSAAPKGRAPRVCLLVGTQDPNFQNWTAHVRGLQTAMVPHFADRITGLEHALPDDAYLSGAMGWLLGKGTEQLEVTLPKSPLSPEDRGCRHLLVRFKGAAGAGAEVKRSETDARKEAEKFAGLLRKEKSDKRLERALKSSEAPGAKEDQGALLKSAADGYGALVLWTCWTLPAGEVRVARSPAGYHAIWAEKQSP